MPCIEGFNGTLETITAARVWTLWSSLVLLIEISMPSAGRAKVDRQEGTFLKGTLRRGPDPTSAQKCLTRRTERPFRCLDGDMLPIIGYSGIHQRQGSRLK